MSKINIGAIAPLSHKIQSLQNCSIAWLLANQKCLLAFSQPEMPVGF
ncbi:hypothetical protein [Chroococcidiopsis sp. SAG 2025]|nr:hypothetical protein [Chroococcidiopsis sp. SAG 2025]